MIYLELVPAEHPWPALTKKILDDYPQITGINVPDILRVHVRSHDAAMALREWDIPVIPHIRAIDRPLSETVLLVQKLYRAGVTRVLIVSGDMPKTPSHICYPVTAEAVIEAIKGKLPEMQVYGALDPYRQSIQAELAYCMRKKKVGADGFFTQPFFDLRLAEIFLEQFSDIPVFCGISPVTSDASLRYWITTNHVVFPPTFAPTLNYNVDLAHKVIDLAQSYGQHVYMMPIKVPVNIYLDALFGHAQ